MWQIAVLSAAALSACAQDVRVYSELTRIDPFGTVVKTDRGDEPREILSPAVPRNGYSTFRVVISGAHGTEFTLYAGQNPENAVGLTLYREVYVRSGQEWIPDGLERIQVPYRGRLSTVGIPGQTAQSFLIDLHVDRNSPVRRIKVEPQVWMVDRWITYPMEVRIVAATIPGSGKSGAVPPPVSAPTDATVRAAYQSALCPGAAAKTEPELSNARALLIRNASQDVRLDAASGHDGWCSPYVRRGTGPEWYLRIRDRLLR